MNIFENRIPCVIVVIFLIGYANADTVVNYDTAWTLVYDGGIKKDGKPIDDVFYDVECMDDGSCYCVGESCDTNNSRGVFLVKLDSAGKILWKNRYSKASEGYSITIARNNDLIIGGGRFLAPLIMRLDTSGNVKWSTWYYDSIKDQRKLFQSAVVNCVKETSHGTIICAAGDEYPDNNGQALTSYAAMLELDSTGVVAKRYQLSDYPGYNIGSFYVDQTETGYYLLSGNQTVLYIDTSGKVAWEKKYTMMLDGVGSMVNNVSRAKMLRNGSLMVAGQAYEGNCWKKYQRLG